jgi:hypothetical protein
MKRSAFAAAVLLLAASSSMAYGVVRSGQWTGMVMGTGSSKLHGTATMKAGRDANTTEVTVSYTGDTPNTTRPWHIHVGSCTKAGGVLGGAKSYTPLLGDAKGAAESKAMLPVALPDTGSYYVNIHESSTAMGTIVACGDLKHDK